MHANPRSFLGAISQIAAGLRDWRDEIRTESLINGLPHQIRKDIGWPEIHAARLARRAGNPFRP